jgi:glycosyltransferase involved in cell wall biosynthesis
MTPPLASIVVVTYKQEALIEEAVMSAVDQEYPSLEVVVTDDASPDRTPDLIAQFAEKWPERVVPVFGSERLGVAGNYNRGLATATGKYIAFLDGDDVFLPGKIAAQVDWFEKDSSRVLCGHDLERFDSESGERIALESELTPLLSGTGPLACIRHGRALSALSAPAVMIRASAIPTYGFDERTGIASDWKMCIDSLMGGGAFGYVDGVYARYRRHSESICATAGHDRETRIRLLGETLAVLALVEAEGGEYVESCRHARADLLYEQGNWHLRRNEMSDATAYLRASLRLSPWLSWRVAASLALSLVPSPLARPVISQLRARRPASW